MVFTCVVDEEYFEEDFVSSGKSSVLDIAQTLYIMYWPKFAKTDVRSKSAISNDLSYNFPTTQGIISVV